jgi:hypothetical protein
MATGRIPINATAAIQSTIVDAKGDIIAATAADTVARLAVGANGTTLVADSSESVGMKWATPTASSPNYALVGTAATSITGNADFTFTGISGKDSLWIYIAGASINQSNSTRLNININGNTSSGNHNFSNYFQYSTNTPSTAFTINNNFIKTCRIPADSTASANIFLRIDGCNGSGIKPFQFIGVPSTNSGDSEVLFGIGYYTGTAAVTSIRIVNDANNGFDAGTITVYGA